MHMSMGINEIVVHAPYIINLANTVKPETYELAVEFLEKEIVRTAAMRTAYWCFIREVM